MENINKILIVVLMLFTALSMGCTDQDTFDDEPNYDELYGEQTATPINGFSKIVNEANRLNDICITEIQATEDLESMLSDDLVFDKNDVLLLIKQKQRQDVATIVCINYVRTNEYIINSESTTGTWATELIQIYGENVEINEVWYDEVEEEYDIKIERPTHPYSHTEIGEPSDERTTDMDYIPSLPPISQTELLEEFTIKTEKLAYYVEEMSNEGIRASQLLTCTASLKTSVVDCRNYVTYFKGWVYQNKDELNRAGITSQDTNLLFENTFLVCDSMDDLCVQLQNIPKY